MEDRQKITNEEMRERLEHKVVLDDIRAVLVTTSGRNFIKYLFRCFEIGDLPDIGLPDEFLRDKLGFLRAGSAVYKIVAEANPEVAGVILGQIEKEKNDQADYDEARGI